MTNATADAAGDLLYGFKAIGAHLGLTARQAEHLAVNGELPTFKMGRRVCARRSTLAARLSAKEAAASGE